MCTSVRTRSCAHATVSGCHPHPENHATLHVAAYAGGGEYEQPQRGLAKRTHGDDGRPSSRCGVGCRALTRVSIVRISHKGTPGGCAKIAITVLRLSRGLHSNLFVTRAVAAPKRGCGDGSEERKDESARERFKKEHKKRKEKERKRNGGKCFFCVWGKKDERDC